MVGVLAGVEVSVGRAVAGVLVVGVKVAGQPRQVVGVGVGVGGVPVTVGVLVRVAVLVGGFTVGVLVGVGMVMAVTMPEEVFSM